MSSPDGPPHHDQPAGDGGIPPARQTAPGPNPVPGPDPVPGPASAPGPQPEAPGAQPTAPTRHSPLRLHPHTWAGALTSAGALTMRHGRHTVLPWLMAALVTVAAKWLMVELLVTPALEGTLVGAPPPRGRVASAALLATLAGAFAGVAAIAYSTAAVVGAVAQRPVTVRTTRTLLRGRWSHFAVVAALPALVLAGWAAVVAWGMGRVALIGVPPDAVGFGAEIDTPPSASGLAVAVVVLAVLLALPLLAAVVSLALPRLAPATPAIVWEVRPGAAALRRSWAMTRRDVWRLTGWWWGLTAVAVAAASAVWLMVVAVQWAAATAARTAPSLDASATSTSSGQIVGDVVVALVWALIGALVTAWTVVVYVDLRIRHEGFAAALAGQWAAAERTAPMVDSRAEQPAAERAAPVPGPSEAPTAPGREAP